MKRARLIASLPYWQPKAASPFGRWPKDVSSVIVGYAVATDAEVLIAKMETRQWQHARFYFDPPYDSWYVQLVRRGASDLWTVRLNGIRMPYCNTVPTVSLLPDTPYEQTWMSQLQIQPCDPSADEVRAMWPAYCAKMRAFLDRSRAHLQL